MSYLKDLQGTMASAKRKNAKKDFFAFYVGRPMSYVLTIPFLYLKTMPNTISVISTIEVVIAAIVLSTATSPAMGAIGMLLFFLWNLLDGVDGNIARLKKISSPMGSVYDAMSGYAAMFLFFFSSGIYAFHITNDSWGFVQIIIGAISGMAQLFPRLVMHKAKSEMNNANGANSLSDKGSYGFVKILGLNLTSISGMVQPLLLIAIFTNTTVLFNLVYCIINVMLMLITLFKILHNE